MGRLRVSVVGAGVAGLVCALELARQGHNVRVFDRSRLGARGNASWCAGGMLAPWCEAETAPNDIIVPGERAIGWWRDAVGGVVQNGTLVVAHPRDGQAVVHYGRRTREWQMLGDEEIARLEPDLAGRFSRALYFPAEAYLDPRAAMAGLERRLGEFGVPVEIGDGLEAGTGIIVDARGFAARGELTDLRGVRGEMLVLRSRDIALSRTVRVLHPHHPIYVVPRGGGVYMVGATMLESSHDGPVTARSMIDLLGAAVALHPAFGEAEIIETAAAVRPAFASNLPQVRRCDNTIHVNGFYRHGFLLAPEMAGRVCEQVRQMQSQEDGSNADHRQWATA